MGKNCDFGEKWANGRKKKVVLYFFGETAIKFRKKYDELHYLSSNTWKHQYTVEVIFKAIRYENFQSLCWEPFWVRSGLACMELEHFPTSLNWFWMLIHVFCFFFAIKLSFVWPFWMVSRHIQAFQKAPLESHSSTYIFIVVLSCVFPKKT